MVSMRNKKNYPSTIINYPFLSRALFVLFALLCKVSDRILISLVHCGLEQSDLGVL